ncbi:cobalt import ABC superfamily ATP binding cassette transporter, ABC protein [Candidatus Vecturithrix granuli]|uniref:Cobalt import ABC superfamily ATP binding cassette transporter, ABC protein n=1 Tax=Vecturithrix granuli TaxID=1499967 RepID=A0A081C7M2_VECG1|nr:cobalt import ABC superfamily ATP binding cassette transporter, ABC protein [Candidatus Vecturithrix granuli]
MRPFMQFEHVSYQYPSQNENALTDVTFSVHPGEFLSIFGADDSGKSTLAKLTNGLLLPAAGIVTIADLQLDAHLKTLPSLQQQQILYRLHQRVGVVFADPENQLVGATVEEDVAFGLGNLRLPSAEIRRRVETYLKQVGLAHYAKRSPHKLSGGEQQKLCIAGILAMEPECLVCDEPLTFLDSASRQEVLALLRDVHASGKTIVYLSGSPEELLIAQRILLLSQGKISGEYCPAALWGQPVLFEEIGLTPPDIITLRAALLAYGYNIQPDSLTPEAIVEDICSCNT